MQARRLVALLIVAGGLFSLTAPAQAGPRTDAEFVKVINAERRAHGLRPMGVSATLTRLARSHSLAMATKGRLWHNDISKSSNHWLWLGQNVGVGDLGDGGLGPSVRRLHQAFMDSPPHRDNILKRQANLFGVGSFIKDGRIWVTVNFEQTTPGWP
jgi:uncharacterized protein YkwD